MATRAEQFKTEDERSKRKPTKAAAKKPATDNQATATRTAKTKEKERVKPDSSREIAAEAKENTGARRHERSAARATTTKGKGLAN